MMLVLNGHAIAEFALLYMSLESSHCVVVVIISIAKLQAPIFKAFFLVVIHYLTRIADGFVHRMKFWFTFYSLKELMRFS